MNVPAWPLAWPEGWKRTTYRTAAPFFKKRGDRRENISISEAVGDVEAELRLLKAGRDYVISTNVKPTLRGAYTSITHDKGDPGAAVYFTLRDQGRCLACDRFTRVPDNLVAIAKHIEAMRMSERYGIGTLDQAFAGYAPRLQSSTLEWWLVLGVPPFASRDQIEAAYRAKARVAHPDAGGSEQEMARLNAAGAVMSATEHWVPIAGWEGLYSVSDRGRVRRDGGGRGAVSGRIMTPQRTSKGYRHVDLSRGDVKTRRLVHQLVATAFLPPRPSPDHHPNHIDADKANNSASNLEWLTNAENTKHARHLGLIPALKGERNGRSKLTRVEVEEIRAQTGRIGQRVIASRYGVARSLIQRVQQGKAWPNEVAR